jgi:hypothetical protein
VRAVPVARKLSTIEEQLREQSSLFQQGDYKNEGNHHEKLSWVRVPVTFSVAWKLSTIEERSKEQIDCFGEEITGTKVTNPKLSSVLISTKMLGLGIIIIFFVIFNDAYGLIRPVTSFREIKIDSKCKYLSNFAAETLRAF